MLEIVASTGQTDGRDCGLYWTDMVEIVACTGQTDVGDCGLYWTERCWRLWPLLDRQMVEIVAYTGQIW